MEPEKINRTYLHNGKEVKAIGILEKGIRIVTKEVAKVSGELIKETVPWDELEKRVEPIQEKEEDMKKNVSWSETVGMRVKAAWHVLRADEFVIATKKHCNTYKESLAGVELLDGVADLVKHEIAGKGMEGVEE